MNEETRALLRTLAERYETADFSDGDPIQFLRGAGSGPNLETTGFVAAALSFGSRSQFLGKIAQIVNWADGDVHGWVLSGAYAERFSPDDDSSFYRLFSHAKMRVFLDRLRDILQRHGSLGEFLKSKGARTGPAAVDAICEAFGGMAAPIVPKNSVSACKRICMFLRWMARDGSPVDYGPWSGWLDRKTLVIPLDVHVARQARRLGLVGGSGASMRVAREVTARLAEVFPDDPLKGDFALYGLGIDQSPDAPDPAK